MKKFDWKPKKGSFKRIKENYIKRQIIKEEAFQKLKDNAKALNANAIVGIKVDIEPLSQSSMLIVSITGTAVNVAAEK